MNLEEFNKIIDENQIIIFQFGSSSCLPCINIAKRIEKYIENQNINYIYLSIDENENKELASSLSIFTVPTILIYIMGKLMVRKSGYFSLEEIFMNIERYKEILS